ncbi:hypothetical protein CLU79DRAFT_762247 [Phycomyces nitens]|nr:hypothetical protein CLU79DRAFT_762247 [Phycomyces nitens]
MDIKNLLCSTSNPSRSHSIDYTLEPLQHKQSCPSIYSICHQNQNPTFINGSPESHSIANSSPDQENTDPRHSSSPQIPSYYNLDTKKPLARRLSQSHTRNPWTPEEDELLKQGYLEGLSWAMISATYLPRRSRGCCWGRFKILQSKTAYSRRQSKQEKYLPALAVQKRTQLFKHAWRLVAQDMLGRFWDEREFESFHLANITPKQRANFLQRI